MYLYDKIYFLISRLIFYMNIPKICNITSWCLLLLLWRNNSNSQSKLRWRSCICSQLSYCDNCIWKVSNTFLWEIKDPTHSTKVNHLDKGPSKEWPAWLIVVFTGVCLQWDSNRAPGVRGGAAAAGGPTREYMPVADKVWSGKTWPAEGPWFLIDQQQQQQLPSMPQPTTTADSSAPRQRYMIVSNWICISLTKLLVGYPDYYHVNI